MAGRVRHTSKRVVGGRRRADRVLVRRPKPVGNLDSAAAEELLLASLTDKRHKPNGTCYDCGRKVSGERTYCGPCFAKHGR